MLASAIRIHKSEKNALCSEMWNMQSAAFFLSVSPVHLLKPFSRFHSLSSNSIPNNLINVASSSSSSSFPRRPTQWPLSSPSFKFRPWRGFSDGLEVKETSESAVESSNNVLLKTAELGGLFSLWIIFNIYFNIYNKQVLKVYHFPLTVTAVQFAVGAALVSFMWGFNLYKRPKLSASQLAAILPLAVVHTLGNLLTNMSLGMVAVSFTHTVKAMEPFFSVILSAMFLGEMPTLWVVGSLVPIVGGVALASATEVSFNWAGFWSAMASNLSNQSRNVLSKKLMVKKEEAIDNITLFSIITVMSFLLTAPVTVLLEGVIFTPAYLQSAGLDIKQVYIRSLLAAVCFHAYQQVAYMLLQRVSPVTHSVGNCVKRVVVIVSSILFFRTPVSPVNAFGTAIALAGVFLYSRVERMKKPKTT